jgi:hypothetical protein
LLDVSRQVDRLPAIGAARLPRISAGDVTIAEGDAGEVTVAVPISIEGTVTRPARLWVQLTDPANFTQPTSGFPLVIAPGATSATVPVTYRADDAFNPFEQRITVTLLARRHAVTGDYDASVVIEEDDPAPRLTVDARRVFAAEGGALEWTFRLSKPMAGSAFWSVQLVAADGRFTELDSDDVPGWFLASYGIDPPVPAVPLADLGIFLSVEFAPGTRETTLAIPIDMDSTSEPREGVALRLEAFEDPVVPRSINLAGFVSAH